MTKLPAHLANRKSRAIATAVTAGLGTSAPPCVSIKGGVFTLIDAAGEQIPIEEKHLDCVIVDVHESVAIQRVFWGKDRPFDPSADSYQAPVCFSDNGIGASVNAAEPQSTLCQTCQWNMWGSATSKLTGKGVKACGAIKKVAVLVPAYDDKGIAFLLRVPIMSHENLRVYGDRFRGQDFDVSDVTTRISFVHGAVGVLDFHALDWLDAETAAMREKVLETKATDALVGRGDMPVTTIGAVTGASPQMPVAHPYQPATAGAGPYQPVRQIPQQGDAPAQAQPEPPKRGRRKAAEAPQPATGGDMPPLPPFLAQTAGSAPASPAAPFGVQSSAPAPNAELAEALDNVFNLKTS